MIIFVENIYTKCGLRAKHAAISLRELASRKEVLWSFYKHLRLVYMSSRFVKKKQKNLKQ